MSALERARNPPAVDGSGLRAVEVDGARLAYLERGNPDGEPIVLLHGYPANHLCWRHQIDGLAETHRVLALDWLGWGASERRLDLRFDYDTEVERLGRALDALGLNAANLFAHDYGGFLSLGFAERNPGRVLRLALLNTRAHASFVARWYVTFALNSLLGRLPLQGALARVLPMSALIRNGLRSEVRRGVIEPEVLESYVGWVSTAAGRRWLLHFSGDYSLRVRPELGQRLAEIRCPTAIVWGETDRYLRPEIAHDLASEIPGAELTMIGEAGHFVAEEAPAQVGAALTRLLERGPV